MRGFNVGTKAIVRRMAVLGVAKVMAMTFWILLCIALIGLPYRNFLQFHFDGIVAD